MHCLFFNGAYASMKVTINLFKKISFWVSAAPKSWPKYTSTFWLYRNITRVIFLNPIKSGIEKWSLQSITRLFTQWKRLTSKHPTQKMDSGHHSNHQPETPMTIPRISPTILSPKRRPRWQRRTASTTMCSPTKLNTNTLALNNGQQWQDTDFVV